VPYQTMLVLVLLASDCDFLKEESSRRHLYALGGNPGAARLSGLDVGHLTPVCTQALLR
jgi:ABC-type xylose transport system permease subunit